MRDSPPISPGVLQAPGVTWPAAVGAMCVVMAVVGFLIGAGFIALGAFGPVFSPSGGRTFIGGAQVGGLDLALGLPGVVDGLISGGARILLAAWLLAGGVMLARRRAIAPRLLWSWALLRIALAIIESALAGAAATGSVAWFQPVVQAIGDAEGVGGAGGVGGVGVQEAVLLPVRLVVGCAWPLLLLWWLGQAEHRREIRRWPR